MNDDLYTNKVIADIVKKNYESIKNDLFFISSEKGYFSPFRSGGMVPEKIVTEIFLRMIVSSLEIGDKSILKEQYIWTKDMLASRGYGCELFLNNYLSYLEDLKQVMIKYANEQNHFLISQYIEGCKKHFLQSI